MYDLSILFFCIHFFIFGLIYKFQAIFIANTFSLPKGYYSTIIIFQEKV